MNTSFIHKHPSIVQAIYMMLLFLFPILSFLFIRGPWYLLVVLFCLLIFITYVQVCKVRYTAIYSPSRREKYLRSDMCYVLVGMLLMFIGLYWFFQGTSGVGSFPAGILIFFSYTIILRKEDFRRYADLIKSKEIPLNPQTILLRKLEGIPTFWLVYASKPAGESADHTIYFELYERGNFLIRCGKGIITINFIRSGIAGEYDIPVEFAVDDYLAHEIKTRGKYQYHTEEEVVDLLKTHGYIIEKLLIENRFYKINNRWNDLP